MLRAKYNMHAFRHFFASWVIQGRDHGGLGYAAKKAQEVPGHSTITLTMDTYGHLFPDEEPDWQAMDQQRWCRPDACDKSATNRLRMS